MTTPTPQCDPAEWAEEILGQMSSEGFSVVYHPSGGCVHGAGAAGCHIGHWTCLVCGQGRRRSCGNDAAHTGWADRHGYAGHGTCSPAEWAEEILGQMNTDDFAGFLADPDAWRDGVDQMAGKNSETEEIDIDQVMAAMTEQAHVRVARVRRRLEDHVRKLAPAAAWPVVSTLASELGISDK